MIVWPTRGTYLGQKKIVPVEKILSPSHRKVCSTNKPNPHRFRGYIDDQYSSKYLTFSPRISGAMGSSLTKKQRKIRFFDYIRNVGGASRHRFQGELYLKNLEYRRIGPNLAATFLFIATSVTKIFSQSGIDPPNYRGSWG